MEEPTNDPKIVAQNILNKSAAEEHSKKVKGARVVLIIIGVINLLAGLYFYYQVQAELEGYFSMALGAIFIALFFLGIKRPMLALILGLVIFLSLHTLNAIIDPSTIVKGIVMKVIFTVLLIRGIVSVNKLPKDKPEPSTELLDDI